MRVNPLRERDVGMRASFYFAAALAAGVAMAGEAGAKGPVFETKLFGGAVVSPTLEGDATLSGTVTVNGPGTLGFNVNTGLLVGGAAGIDWKGFTLEGELAYRQANADSFFFSGPGVSVNSKDYSASAFDEDVKVFSLLGNSWYNVKLGKVVDLYGGGGLGVGRAKLREGDSGAKFAWQLGAGIDFQLSRTVSLGVGYRYFNVKDALEADLTASAGFFSETAHGTTDYTDNSVITELGFKF
jgi:opacity protein-like surface antigen